MEGLFYSTEEKILFYIPKNYTNGSGILKVLINNLKEAEKVIKEFNNNADVYAREITNSTRYKHMWCFHIHLDKCPDEAFELGKGWSMSKWINL